MNKWKFATVTLVLVVALLVSAFAVLYQPSFEVEAKQPVLLNVSIDGETKIGANTPTPYMARVFGGEGDLTYTWSISPDDSNVMLEPDGSVCTLTFTTATEEPYTLEVKVYDEAGNFGVASMAVIDPPTYPDYYIGVSTAPYSYLIKTDGTGWYYAVDGNTGAVSWSSTNAKTIFTNAGVDNALISLTAGSFIISEQIDYTGKSNITIMGQGASSKLILADSVNLPMFECASTSNMVFENLYFDGNVDGQVGAEDTLFEISTAQHFRFRNNYVIDTWGDVVTGHNAVDVICEGNYAENCDEDAFHAHGGSYWKIINNHIVGGKGVINFYNDAGQTTTDCIASGNTIINCSSTSGAIRFDGNGNYLRITVANNIVTTPLNNGISIDAVGLHEDITIEGNQIEGGTHGIWLAKTGVGTYKNINVIGNTFNNQSLQGIMVEVPCTN
ncbi:MAG: hypothetical protein WC325_12770, partial [Candidatus Bathyarchaeia archaeon]